MHRSVTSWIVLVGSLYVVPATQAVGPDYQTPVPTVPATFENAEKVQARKAGAPPDLATWWVGFHDPALTRIVARAVAQNQNLAQAFARVTQARAQLQLSRANLLPKGQADGQVSYVRLSRVDPFGIVSSSSPLFRQNTGFYTAGVSASWEIDVFGGLRRGVEAASAEYREAEAGRRAVQLSVAAEAADAYVLIRTFQARLSVVREQAATQRHLVDLIRLQFERGVSAELQLRQAEGALAPVLAEVPTLETGLATAYHALDVVMGADDGTYRAMLAKSAPIPVAPAVKTAEGPASLLRRRPDLIAAEQRLRATNARVGQSLSDYYPKVSLAAMAGSASIDEDRLFNADATQAQVGLQVHWRLFDFGRVDAEVRSARGRYAEALAAYRQTLLQATREVEDAFAAVVNAEAQTKVLADGEEALAKARASALAAYQNGSSNLIDVLDADTRLLQIREARIQAQSDATRSVVASFKALGGGWNN